MALLFSTISHVRCPLRLRCAGHIIDSSTIIFGHAEEEKAVLACLALSWTYLPLPDKGVSSAFVGQPFPSLSLPRAVLRFQEFFFQEESSYCLAKPSYRCAPEHVPRVILIHYFLHFHFLVLIHSVSFIAGGRLERRGW